MSYLVARTLPEIEAALARAGDAPLVMAGGTDLMVRARERVAIQPVLDVAWVPELLTITLERRPRAWGDDEQWLRVGAAVTYGQCLADPLIRRACPLLARVAERFASPQIRHVATLGGNVANASPAADGLAALWALDARVEVVTPDSRVTLPIEQVVLGPGRLGIPPRSVLTAFSVRAALPGEGAAFYKLVNRAWPQHPMAVSVASVAVRIVLDDAGRIQLARIVLGAVAPTPVRALEAESALVSHLPTPPVVSGAAARVVAASRPISDVRATAEYRGEVLPALAATAIEAALQAARSAAPSGDVFRV